MRRSIKKENSKRKLKKNNKKEQSERKLKKKRTQRRANGTCTAPPRCTKFPKSTFNIGCIDVESVISQAGDEGSNDEEKGRRQSGTNTGEPGIDRTPSRRREDHHSENQNTENVK